MKKVTVELDWNTVDKIIQTELKDAYESLKQDMVNRSCGRGFAIFHKDESEDIAQIAEQLYCLQRVMEYWGVTF